MTVALPSVSTAGSRRMRTWRAAIRWTPIASAMVTIAGSPSGTAATASDTADMNTSSGGRPRTNPSAAVTATIPRQRTSSVWLTRASRVCSGVVVSVAPASRCAIFPSSVAMPVATTSARAAPAATDVPMKTQSNRSASGASAGTGVVSLLDRRALAGQRGLVRRQQVRLDEARVGGDDVARLEHEQIARHDVAAAISTRRPSRSTVARGAVIDRSASSAFSARPSWKKPTSAFSTTIVAIATASATSPRNPDTAAAPSSSQMSGLASCRASSRQRDVRCAR